MVMEVHSYRGGATHFDMKSVMSEEVHASPDRSVQSAPLSLSAREILTKGKQPGGLDCSRLQRSNNDEDK